MENIDYHRLLVETLEGRIKIQRDIINLKNEKIERLENIISGFEIDQNNESKIREQKVWTVKLQISK